MKLFDDMVMFEFKKDEWMQEKAEKKIILPNTAESKQEGEFQERAPIHFFKVIAIGPDCKKVKIGDRIFPKPPNINRQPTMQPIMFWLDGKKEVRYVMEESSIGGIE